jgi:hypothetical protein
MRGYLTEWDAEGWLVFCFFRERNDPIYPIVPNIRSSKGKRWFINGTKLIFMQSVDGTDGEGRKITFWLTAKVILCQEIRFEIFFKRRKAIVWLVEGLFDRVRCGSNMINVFSPFFSINDFNLDGFKYFLKLTYAMEMPSNDITVTV